MRGGRSLARKDVEGIATLLVDAEMKMFSGLSTPVIFLQNVVVDLLLGLGFDDAFRIFADHVRGRYGAEPGFITMNLPCSSTPRSRSGVENPIVCCNINKIGFRMCGGVEAYEEALRDRTFRPIAMSVFASGAIPAREALEWVARSPTSNRSCSARRVAPTSARPGRSSTSSGPPPPDPEPGQPGINRARGARVTSG